MARQSSDVKPGPPEWSKGCVTLPLTVGNDTVTQCGLITFPQELITFLQEGHTFTIEGSINADEFLQTGIKRTTSINLSVDIFGDEDPTNNDNKE